MQGQFKSIIQGIECFLEKSESKSSRYFYIQKRFGPCSRHNVALQQKQERKFDRKSHHHELYLHWYMFFRTRLQPLVGNKWKRLFLKTFHEAVQRFFLPFCVGSRTIHNFLLFLYIVLFILAKFYKCVKK